MFVYDLNLEVQRPLDLVAKNLLLFSSLNYLKCLKPNGNILGFSVTLSCPRLKFAHFCQKWANSHQANSF